jgi:predicted nucleic acid-binding protein
MGIEPTSRAWEAPILPLNYARTSLTLPNPTVSCKKSPYRWRRYFLPIPIWEGDATISFVIICNNDCARCSTLILITKIDLVDSFLANVAREVAVPGEVARECCAAKKTLDALIIQKALHESRIKLPIVKNKKLVAKLSSDFSLGKGEAEVISLAVKMKAALVGIDDKMRHKCVQTVWD